MRPRIYLPQDSGKVPAFEPGVASRLGRASLSAAQNGPAISASQPGVANHSAAAPVICRGR